MIALETSELSLKLLNTEKEMVDNLLLRKQI